MAHSHLNRKQETWIRQAVHKINFFLNKFPNCSYVFEAFRISIPNFFFHRNKNFVNNANILLDTAAI